jgi:Tol biopolymer transport system component
VVGGEGGASRIHLVDPDGGGARPVVPGAGAAQADPDWSPDGSRIAFRQGEGSSAEIAVVTVEGGGSATVLTDNDVEDGAPVFSPSGERVVFVSRRPDDRSNLWVMDADGSDAESLTTVEEGEEAADPDWL